MEEVQVRAVVTGQVQGVGFRWWTARQAEELAVRGHAVNLPGGEVEVVAQGPRPAVDRLMDRLQPDATGHERPGSVAGVMCTEMATDPTIRGFTQG